MRVEGVGRRGMDIMGYGSEGLQLTGSVVFVVVDIHRSVSPQRAPRAPRGP